MAKMTAAEKMTSEAEAEAEAPVKKTKRVERERKIFSGVRFGNQVFREGDEDELLERFQKSDNGAASARRLEDLGVIVGFTTLGR